MDMARMALCRNDQVRGADLMATCWVQSIRGPKTPGPQAHVLSPTSRPFDLVTPHPTLNTAVPTPDGRSGVHLRPFTGGGVFLGFHFWLGGGPSVCEFFSWAEKRFWFSFLRFQFFSPSWENMGQGGRKCLSLSHPWAASHNVMLLAGGLAPSSEAASSRVRWAEPAPAPSPEWVPLALKGAGGPTLPRNEPLRAQPLFVGRGPLDREAARVLLPAPSPCLRSF